MTEAAPPTTAAVIARIRAWRRAQDWTPHRYALKAGVAPSTLREMDDDCWSPSFETARKLEALIPLDWREGPAAEQPAEAA